MCASALRQIGTQVSIIGFLEMLLTILIGIRKVFFGCGNEKFGGNGSVFDVHSEYVFPRTGLKSGTSCGLNHLTIYYTIANGFLPLYRRLMSLKGDTGEKMPYYYFESSMSERMTMVNIISTLSTIIVRQNRK